MLTARMVGALAAAYLCGAIPTGYWMARLRGVDLRRVGSGNIGATNVARALGKPWGVACLLLDAFKGWLPVTLLTPARWAPDWPSDAWMWAVGVSAIAGHMFTPFLKFKGGKGVATSIGVLAAIAPAALGIAAAVGVAFVALTGYVSVGAIAGAVLLPWLVWGLGTSHRPAGHVGWSFTVTLALAALIVWKHRSNVARLRAGTENKLFRGLLGKAGPARPSELR